jgi:ribonuclease BN (tRNA processing enzyme)
MGKKPALVKSWQGNNLAVKVLFSLAGVAQHIWIEDDSGAVLVDAGDGLIRDILSCKLDAERIRGVIFTHGHFDHMGGLHSLLGFLRMIGRKETLPIHAPKGCTEVFSIARNFMNCYPDTIPFEISCKEVHPGEIFRIGGMTIKAYPVVHCGSIEGAGILDPIPALGYRISYQKESVAITGDTGICPSLRELVGGADLAIIEATHEKSKEVSQETLEKVHLSADLAEELGKLAKKYILIHQEKKGVDD